MVFIDAQFRAIFPLGTNHCASQSENFSHYDIYFSYIRSRNNAKKYYCVRRYYFTRIWKILHWKYHRDICKKHSRNIFPLCHMIANTSRTLVKDMISNTRYFWRGKFYLFFVESTVYPAKSQLQFFQCPHVCWTISRYKLATWKGEIKGIILNCVNISIKYCVQQWY